MLKSLSRALAISFFISCLLPCSICQGRELTKARERFFSLHSKESKIVSLPERVTYDWLEANEELITDFFAGTYRAQDGVGDVCLFPSRLRAVFQKSPDYDKDEPKHKLFAKIPWQKNITFDVEQCYLAISVENLDKPLKVQLFAHKSKYPIVSTASREKVKFNAGKGYLEFTVKNGGHMLDGGLWRDRWTAKVRLQKDKQGNINVTETESNLSPIPLEEPLLSKTVNRYRLVKVD